MFSDQRFFILRIVVLVILLYILFCLFYGKKNIFSYRALKKEINILHNELDLLKITRIELEKRLCDISSRTIDADLIEEIAKKELFFTKKNELIIINHDNIKDNSI